MTCIRVSCELIHVVKGLSILANVSHWTFCAYCECGLGIRRFCCFRMALQLWLVFKKGYGILRTPPIGSVERNALRPKQDSKETEQQFEDQSRGWRGPRTGKVIRSIHGGQWGRNKSTIVTISISLKFACADYKIILKSKCAIWVTYTWKVERMQMAIMVPSLI